MLEDSIPESFDTLIEVLNKGIRGIWNASDLTR